MRLIDGDELIVKLYQDQPMNWTGSDAEVQELNDWELFRNMVNNAPTVDAEIVVRCKDCKYLVSVNANGKGIPTCQLSGMEVAPNEFCRRGEKGDSDDGN